MLCDKFAESGQSVITVKEVDFQLLAEMVEALYKKEIALSLQSVEAMLELAERLQVPLVITACHQFLQDHIEDHATTVLPVVIKHSASGEYTEFALDHLRELFIFQLQGADTEWHLALESSTRRGEPQI
ncbi:hypothetical protein WJX72_008562 [[Myrmecia] bisecta]|uniref:BTB domain-containing protein n=1 Tax=[Myrmecia] bisecta TaxID=41462 RepID=A0AAW1Q1W7_9CHLO